MARRWISSVASVTAGGTATWGIRRPSLMAWPSWVEPAVAAATGAVVAGATWWATDTLLRAPTRPSLLIRRPLIAGVTLLGVAGLAAAARRIMVPRLEEAGRGLDPGFAQPPQDAEVSGGPGSVVAYDTVGREGARYVHSASSPDVITDVGGRAPVSAPIRVFVGWESAATPQARVDLAMAELRRTHAFDRSTLLVQAPAGSGYANPTPVQVLEIATAGDCASVAVGYGLLPSFLSLDRIELATDTQRLLLEAVIAEIASRPVDSRPRLMLYGESLGARVQQRALDPGRLAESGVHSALWVGTPGGLDSDRFRAGLTETPVIVDRPEQLPVPTPVPHPRVWFLEHDGDPVVRLRRDVLYRRPHWLAQSPRGRNVPEGMTWLPLVTWIQVLIDTLFATNVVPGEFDSRGHDYRADLGAVVLAAFDGHLPAGGPQHLEDALRRLEVERAARIGG
jgi:uncharacterized membrane protein